MDIYHTTPCRQFPENIFKFTLGNIEAQLQIQEGFMRLAVFTSCAAAWKSPVLVADKENTIILLNHFMTHILTTMHSSLEPISLKVIKGGLEGAE